MDHQQAHAGKNLLFILKTILIYMRRVFVILVSLMILTSCQKDEEQSGNDLGVVADQSFFVLNEGAFGQGNASLCVMDAKEETYCDAFSMINEVDLGDVLQSASIVDEDLFLVVNGSDIIWRVDLPSLQVKDMITGMGSPRKVIKVANRKAYISDFTSEKIHILDLETNMLDGAIAFNGWSEDMEVTNGEVWFANPELFGGPRTEKIFIADPDSDTVTDSIVVGRNPVAIEVDDEGIVWALASGNPFNGDDAILVKIDPLSRDTLKSWNLPGAYYGKLALENDGDHLAILLDKVYVMEVSTEQIARLDGFGQEIMTPYGIAFDKRYDNNLWITDARDYSSPGKVYRIDLSTFKIVEERPVGINPNDLVFY